MLDLTLRLGLYWGFPCRGCWFVFLMSNKLMSKLRFWGGLWAADWLLAAVLARADFLGGAAGHLLQHARLGYGQHSVHDELLLAVQEGAEATRTPHSINVVVIQSVSSSVVAATGGATQHARHGRNWLARSAPLPTIGALCMSSRPSHLYSELSGYHEQKEWLIF